MPNTENDDIASRVSQSTGTTVEELVKQKEGSYADPVTPGVGLPSGQEPSTVHPFGGMQ